MINESVRRAVGAYGVVLESSNLTSAHEYLQNAHDSIRSHIAEIHRRGDDTSSHKAMLKHIEDLQDKLKAKK